MQLLYVLLVLLVLTRIGAELAERCGQPALVGELIAGVVLGLVANRYAAMLPILSGVSEDEVFRALTDLAIFFLMLLAGIELHPKELVKASGRALAVALGGMALPLVSGLGLGWAFLPSSPYKLAQSLFLGTALAITAVPVSVKVLMDLGQLKTKFGQTIVSAAVIDDVFSLMLLAVLTAVLKTGSLPDTAAVGSLVGKVVLFFAISCGIGYYVFPRIGRALKRVQAQEFEFSALLVASLAYALLAEMLGMHFILGAFLAGLFFVHRTINAAVYERIRTSVTSITIGFFAPIFFASIGLHLDLAAAFEIPLFVGSIVLAAFLGKLLGAGLPAYVSGFRPREALAVGAAMSARGAVELIIAGIALRAGLFNQPDPAPPVVGNLFSAVVVMALLTTLATPLFLRPLLNGNRRADKMAKS